MKTPLPPPIADYLDRHHVVTLATQGPEGPWAAAVFYAHLDWCFYFVSSPRTRHGRNLERDPRCAATIQADHSDWMVIQGVQLEGVVSAVPDAEKALAMQVYGAKFPFVNGIAQTPAPLAEALAKVHWYRLQATRLHYTDNNQGFGHREKIEFDPG